jgi:rubrerythrin
VAIELTAYLARHEPDEYIKMAFDFGLLEDFDHLYRYSQMLDLVHGKDPNEILQGRTDVFPGRPTQDHHNDPALRILRNYDKQSASPITKSHILTLMSGEQQTWNYYKTNGNYYGAPEVRQLYAEISEVEEEHVSQYESLIDPTETWLEKWVMHEFNEVANYYTCYMTEVDPRIKQIWEQFLDYELEHLRIAGDFLKRREDKDPREICGVDLPTPATFETNRDYVTDVLERTVSMRLIPGGDLQTAGQLPANWSSTAYQKRLNGARNPSESVVAMRIGAAGSELLRTGDSGLASSAGKFRTSLDKEKAPNTVSANGKLASSVESEKSRLGELAEEVEDFEIDAGQRVTSRAGQGAESRKRSSRAGRKP